MVRGLSSIFFQVFFQVCKHLFSCDRNSCCRVSTDDRREGANGPDEKGLERNLLWIRFSRPNGMKHIVFSTAKVTLTFQMTRNAKAFEVWVVCSLQGHFPITVLEMLPSSLPKF
jgi:hypothetical protein